jgi:hypothetical protein
VSLDVPSVGDVIRYGYLWKSESDSGRLEGRKDRPCAVVIVATTEGDESIITVLPITHTQPADTSEAIEIPAATKQRLDLDDERSWIVLTEANRFRWPGPDLRFVQKHGKKTARYGTLPYAFIQRIRIALVERIRNSRVEVVRRS